MAPEVASRSGTIGPWIDSYGIGAILYQVLTGWMPFSFQLIGGKPAPVSVDHSLGLAVKNRYVATDVLNARAPHMLVDIQVQAMATDARLRPSISEIDTELAPMGSPSRCRNPSLLRIGRGSWFTGCRQCL